jgi:class 3 adenylate cyclase/tetratricopeptide (TPR) repeat protein
MRCTVCGTENEPGRKFCGECGSALALICPSCGTPNPPGTKFCGECGTALTAVGTAAPPAQVIAQGDGGPAPSAERRLVSVLFADLVGFTTLSESRDAEEVRELLTRYFDTCRTLIARYGGIVEKFIGDAVMAVWGTPTAKEDDAERAVRAGLDLVQAVAALGQEVGASDLRARAGVLTGEAAVTLGAEGQGMVAGDLVNTASRIQSAAAPGQVFVGEATVRSSEAGIGYEDAGEHELKGKAEPVRLWRALRIVGGVRGSLRSAGLEAPFVGRDRELRLVKELFHASAEENKAQLVSITGIAGIGKSRLSWEFEKYVDGLARDTFWHRGRCLSYGEGVAYWALTDMVKMRCRIAEEDPPEVALEHLRTTLAQNVPDPEERRWVEPRVAHLLGLDEGQPGDQETLFSAWRIFFERLAQQDPTVLVFEDMQWADTGLLDFIEYLLEWSRSYPLFVLVLARPELADKRPSWGAGKRAFTSMYLEPLSAEAMEELMSGLVPGLPNELREQILARAEGVPLYAVETVRMLLDRGLVTREGDVYRPAGPIESLEVPETLHALIAARLDGLAPDERRVIQDGAVLGKTFFKEGLAAVTGISEEALDPILSSLLRKEVLSLQADPRSPERGQYGFLQDLVRKVAYDTLSKRERKAKHLSAVAFILRGWTGEEEEVVEVVADHYLQAYESAPDADDADEIRSKCREMLARAGERASSLAAHLEAQHHFEQAAELADEPATRAKLIERAGMAARSAGDTDGAIERFERAVELFEGEGHTHPAARVSARLGEAMWQRGRLSEALDRMERSYEVLSAEEHDEDFAVLASQLGRFDFFGGRVELADERSEVALDVAEGLWLPEVLSHALNTKALVLYSAKGRRREAYALLKYALDVALENDVASAAHRSYFNIADLAAQSDRYQEAKEYVDLGLAYNRRLGNRPNEWQFLGQAYPFFALGEWDTLLDMLGEIPTEKVAENRLAASALTLLAPLVHVNRGDVDAASAAFDTFPPVDESADVQEIANADAGRAVIDRARGRSAEALEGAKKALAYLHEVGPSAEQSKEAFVVGLEAAFDLDDFGAAEELLAMIEAFPRGKRPEFLAAHDLRFRARMAAIRGDSAHVESGFKGAAGLFREIEFPFYMAVTLLEHGEWLVGHARAEEAGALLIEARDVFERLKAQPWIDRVEKASASSIASSAPG